MKPGTLVYICVSAERGVAKCPVERAVLRTDEGIEGDVHSGRWHRQVSVLDIQAVEAFRQTLSASPSDRVDSASEPACAGSAPSSPVESFAPGAFGENLGVEGIDLSRLGLGSHLLIGSNVQLMISQVGKDCHSPCRIYEEMGDCIMPRVGLFARVVEGGPIVPGDSVTVLKAIDRSLFQTVVLTISDRCARGEARDTAGPATAHVLRETGAFHIYRENVLPDEEKTIRDALRHYAGGHGIDLVVTVGGTGFSPRDVTPEATRAVVERPAPGLDEAMRAASLAKTPYAMLSRAVSGIRGTTLIVNLPGSDRAAIDNLLVILPALPHALEKLRGDPAECGPPRPRVDASESQQADGPAEGKPVSADIEE